MMALPFAWVLTLASLGSGDHGYKAVSPQIFEREKKAVPDIWALDFTFRKPRYIMADIPGKGRRMVWYMTYQLVNRTGEERRFIPRFTLVTDKGQVYHDVILPSAEKAVTAREDPTRTKPFLNSVTISDPIPPTGPDSAPVVRYGVVFWENVDLNAKAFTIYVTGLSNGYNKREDPKTKETVMERKTLKLEFIKPGDVYLNTEKEIEMAGEPEWIYR